MGLNEGGWGKKFKHFAAGAMAVAAAEEMVLPSQVEAAPVADQRAEHVMEEGAESSKAFAQKYEHAYPHLNLASMHFIRSADQSNIISRQMTKYTLTVTTMEGRTIDMEVILPFPAFSKQGQGMFDTAIKTAFADAAKDHAEMQRDEAAAPLDCVFEKDTAERLNTMRVIYDEQERSLKVVTSSALADHKTYEVIHHFGNAKKVTFSSIPNSGSVKVTAELANGASETFYVKDDLTTFRGKKSDTP